MSPTDLSAPSDSGISTAQANPSVSKAQWASYALRKLRDGYDLIQAPNGRTFHFYKAGEPMQPCATHAAKKLVAMGLLVPMKTDARGTRYVVREAFLSDGPAA